MGDRLEKNSAAVRKRIENHTFTDEHGEEYEASEFGGFGDYFRRKKIKLQNLDVELRAAAGDKPQIFKGVVAHVMGFTNPPLHVLHKELVQHGAGFLQYLDSKTMATHIIASTMPLKKVVEYKQYRVVRPEWVTESIKAGKLLPWSDFRVFNDGPRQKTIKFGGGKMFSQKTPQKSPESYRDHTNNQFYTSQVLNSSSPAKPDTPSKSIMNSITNAPEDDIPEVDERGDDMDLDLLIERPTAPEQTRREPGGESAEVYSPSTDRPTEAQQPVDDTKTEVTKDPPTTKVLTSEEHNAILLADPHVRKSSTANPDFLKQYYSESRLHHLSTWKAQLKSRMQSLAAEKRPATAARSLKRKPGERRYIMHVDFDSFFCAVSLKKAPEYCDKPAVVAHGSGTGSEIASCNYPARKFGVKNGMWMKRALELCPELKILPYDFPGYEDASRHFYDAILEIGGVVQSVSIDEALVDVTSLVLAAAGSDGVGISEGSIYREQQEADKMASDLRERVKQKTGCNVSVGIGGNILLAKIALRKAKPAGQHQVRPEGVLETLGELKVEDLPGVAYSIGGRLEEIGVKFVKDIRQTPKEKLVSLLGPKTGEKLWEYARGIDRAEVGEQPIRKSVSADVNWGIRFINQQEAEDFVRNLSKELERRLLNEGVRGKHLTMKIMRRAADAPLDPPKHLGHGKCDTFNKSVSFGVATNNGEQIGKEAVAILRSFKFSPGDLRGIGVQMTKLEPLKASSAAAPLGSQKKLDFGNAFTAGNGGASPGPATMRQKPEPIDDDSGSEKAKQRDTKHPDRQRSQTSAAEQWERDDPVTEDPLTPRKPKTPHPALALSRAGAADAKAHTLLNVRGTQFVLPSQADPALLAELPQDIRNQLLRQASGTRTQTAKSIFSSPSKKNKNIPFTEEDIPPGIDPDIFKELPEELKAEVRESYSRGQSLSPSKKEKFTDALKDGSKARTRPRSVLDQMISASARDSREETTDSTGSRSRQHTPFATDLASGRDEDEFPEEELDPYLEEEEELIDEEAEWQQRMDEEEEPDDMGDAEAEPQSNGNTVRANQQQEPVIDDLDTDFLGEMPDDVRRELMDDYRQRRLAEIRQGLVTDDRNSPHPDARQRNDNSTNTSRKPSPAASLPGGQTKLDFHFPPRPPKIEFFGGKDTSLKAVKDAMMVWYSSFRKEGPKQQDVDALEKYMACVVVEERDMDKVTKLIKWLSWTIDDDEDNGQGAKEKWNVVLVSVKEAVQEAMRTRELGELKF